MNRVTENLLVLLSLDPGRPGALDRILHFALHSLVVVEQDNSVLLPWSNTNHFGCGTFTGDLPEEEDIGCKLSLGEICADLEVIAHFVQLLKKSKAEQLAQCGQLFPIVGHEEQAIH